MQLQAKMCTCSVWLKKIVRCFPVYRRPPNPNRTNEMFPSKNKKSYIELTFFKSASMYCYRVVYFWFVTLTFRTFLHRWSHSSRVSHFPGVLNIILGLYMFKLFQNSNVPTYRNIHCAEWSILVQKSAVLEFWKCLMEVD